MPLVLASGDSHGYQGGLLSRRPYSLRGVLLHGSRLWHRDDAGPRRGPCRGHRSGPPAPGAVAQAVAATSLEGKDTQRLLWDWMVSLEQSMASEGGPAIPNPLRLGGSEHEHAGGRPPDHLLIVGQQQGLLPRQPVGNSANLPFAIKEETPRLRAALSGQAEGDQADRADRLNGNGGHGGVASRTRTPRPSAASAPGTSKQGATCGATATAVASRHPCLELTTIQRSSRDLATDPVVTGARPRESALGPDLDRGAEICPPS
jgi:hypothetical protein